MGKLYDSRGAKTFRRRNKAEVEPEELRGPIPQVRVCHTLAQLNVKLSEGNTSELDRRRILDEGSVAQNRRKPKEKGGAWGGTLQEAETRQEEGSRGGDSIAETERFKSVESSEQKVEEGAGASVKPFGHGVERGLHPPFGGAECGGGCRAEKGRGYDFKGVGGEHW